MRNAEKKWKSNFLIHIMDQILQQFQLNSSPVNVIEPSDDMSPLVQVIDLMTLGNKPVPETMLTKKYVAVGRH